MIWNWQQEDWPNFRYQEGVLQPFDNQFLHQSGFMLGIYEHIDQHEKLRITVSLMGQEAIQTSAIEGEYLNRESVQSSIQKKLGLTYINHKVSLAEQGICDMMIDLHCTFDTPLTPEMLFRWHNMVTNGRNDLKNRGIYRSDPEPMQVVSGYIGHPKVHFEAPPSERVPFEMDQFIHWFNDTAPSGPHPLPALIRAGIAHLYFVCIHPFEDGNGRLARALCEKVLAQHLGQPTLIALSSIINQKKKDYYHQLEGNNKNCEISPWLIYFSQTILESQAYTKKIIGFSIKKAKIYDKARKISLNSRQEKAIERMEREGPEGFKGGLSADNYIKITKTSRATATRDLQDLVEKGLLIRTGELRFRRYFLNLDE